MAIGENVSIVSHLSGKTTGKASIKSNVSKASKVKAVPGQPSKTPGTDTYKTTKMTFYIREDIYAKLKNFAYWDRHTLTEAFNLVVEDGLKGKNTKARE